MRDPHEVFSAAVMSGGYQRGSRPAFNVTKRATHGHAPSSSSSGGSVPFLIKAAVVGGVVAASLYLLSNRQKHAGKADDASPGTSGGAEKHEKKDVNAVLQELSATAAKLRPTLRYSVTATRVEDNATVKGQNQKKVHFIRHGEGYHNVAQREWRQAAKPGEPYTIDTDPEYKFIDAVLTPVGVEQVRVGVEQVRVGVEQVRRRLGSNR